MRRHSTWQCRGDAKVDGDYEHSFRSMYSKGCKGSYGHTVQNVETGMTQTGGLQYFGGWSDKIYIGGGW